MNKPEPINQASKWSKGFPQLKEEEIGANGNLYGEEELEVSEDDEVDHDYLGLGNVPSPLASPVNDLPDKSRNDTSGFGVAASGQQQSLSIQGLQGLFPP
jgi:hypothetical protein